MSDSIKVAIKVRPLIKREKDENSPIQWLVQGNNIVANDAELRKRGDGGFQFDNIFDTNASNNDVFDDIVKPIVNAAVNGFNGTVFAYGQTSSGKTYTMMGGSEESGIIPLAVEHMFDAIANTPGREFLLRVSYLEIYNEKVNDLLTKTKDSTDLKVHEDINGQVFVKCKEEVTNCPENVLSIMNKGNKNRKIGETNMNERSSRSHTIFRITIESREAGAASDGAIQVSQLNLVDLAGSERARQTGTTGERFKEGRHINLSLSTLALVIKQLSESPDSQKYINFRDSKLTRLLQASLGGNAMTAIICAVTPVALEETQCTLSFATRARNIKNKPELNEVMSDGVLLKRYAKQIDMLHTELEKMKQFTRSTDFQEMESKMQEKDRINEELEKRIRKLQTCIVHGDNRNNTESFKCKEKRRQTWCGTGGYKLNAFQTCTNLSPIKEMSPMKSRNSTNIMNTSSQIALADFELELLNSEVDYGEESESDDDDTFQIYRKRNQKIVKFTDDVIIHQSPITNYDTHDVSPERTETFTQTSFRSPDTPKETLRGRIDNLTLEYTQLQEFTTLEKQLYLEDHTSEIKAKFSTLEKQLENIKSDKESFEHVASELRKKLRTAEERYISAEDKLNSYITEVQRIPDLEKKIAQLSALETEAKNVPELHKQIDLLVAEKNGYEYVASDLRKKLNESEQRNIKLEEELAAQNAKLGKSCLQPLSQNKNTQQVELENRITAVASENNELQCKITDLQNKLTEAESCNDSMKGKLDEQQKMLKKFQDLEERIGSLTSEKNTFELTIYDMQNKLKEAEEVNNLIRNELSEREIEIQKCRNHEKQIEQLVAENKEFKLNIGELQEQLIEAEIRNHAVDDKNNDQQQDAHQSHFEKQIQDVIKEKLQYQHINEELKGELKEMKLINSSLQDKLDEYDRKLCEPDSLEKTLASENNFEHTISELQEKLKEAELYNNSMNEELNIQQVKAQKAIDEQKKCVGDFTFEKNKLEDTICELEEKLKRMELHNDLMKNRIDEQELQLQKTHDLEKEIECLTMKTKEFESAVHEWQEKLAHAEHSILAKDESDGQYLQKIQALEEQITRLTSEKEEQISTKLCRMKSNEKESMYDCSDNDEINHLKGRINNLQGIIQDVQKENAYLKEQASAGSILDHECNLSNGDSSKVIEDMSITRMSLEENSAKLSADLILKTQELNEIKQDVQGLKELTENLEKTIYLLTTENSKLSEEKEGAEKLTIHLQQRLDEYYAENLKTLGEKLELENNVTILNEQIEGLLSRMPEVNSSEEQIILRYEEQIGALTAKNTELSSKVTNTMKELEMLKESKSLLYEHDCMFKDQLTDLMAKHEYLITENNELSVDLMDKIEERDVLKEECDILKNRLELLLKHKEEINNDDAEKLKMENTLLKTEQVELKANIEVLSKENWKMSHQLVETMEDLDNAQKINSCNNTLQLSTFNNTLMMNDTTYKSLESDDAEATILRLQEEVNRLTHLNRKLSDFKLGACTQCVYLQELSENRRMLKLEVKALTHKLEDSQRKFNREVAKSDPLILKAKEDVNISVCNSTLNASFLENMNVSFVEERLQHLNNELHNLKEDHDKLTDLYKEKCNEVEELQNSSVTNLSPIKTCNVSIKKSPSKTSSRLENIEKIINDLQNDFDKLRKDTVRVKTDLAKFTNEKECLLNEIKSLKIANEELLQKLSKSEQFYLEKTDILENEIRDTTKKLQEFSVKCKEIEDAKLFLEVEAEHLKEDKAMKEQTMNELRQSLSCLQHELDLTKEREKERENESNCLEQEYEKKLELLKSMIEELTNSKEAISQEFANYSKESDSRLTELSEKIVKCTSENEYLKQELIKLRDIENKFETMRNEYQFKTHQDKTLADDNKKLKNILNNTSKDIIKEIKSLKPKVDAEEFLDKPVNDLFQIFLETIMAKEKEIVKTMREHFNKEKQKLEDDKRQSVDVEKRTMLWAKELETEIDKLQGDLSQREAASDELKKEVARLVDLLKENNRDRDALRDKISLLETDFNNLQSEFNRYSKMDTMNEEAIVIAQKRERQAQEAIRSKEAEFQTKLKSEKETYNKRIEDLTCMLESFKTKNMELTGNIEGLEANQKQLKNIIDLKNNELMKSNQIIQKMQSDTEQLTEVYNDLNRELEEKNLRIEEITKLLKTKCDDLTEYKANLETIASENAFLKQQIGERKVSADQYKMEIDVLKMEKKKEIDAINDKLNFESLKSVELNKQVDELNNKNATLTEKMNILKDDYATLQHKCATLEKRVRNSTSKILAEEQMEELKDLNRSLRNNLDGASNRITELQEAKTELMKQLITLKSQYDAACKDNQELKEKLSSYKSKYDDKYAACDKYNTLLQEKNKIALELEAIKVELSQKTRDIENHIGKIKQLTEKNMELDQESDELAKVIREHDAENTKVEDQLWTCRNENDELREKIQALENKIQKSQSQSVRKTTESCNDECSCTALKTKIRELQMEVVSKNGKVAALELQIRSGSFPYQNKCRELEEHLSAYKTKINELKVEVKRLQVALLRTSAKECDLCRQRFMNRRDQSCQTMPNNILRFCGTSSGIIEDEIRITKLEKEKQFMKDVCRSRTKKIKQLEKQVEEYEQMLQLKNT